MGEASCKHRIITLDTTPLGLVLNCQGSCWLSWTLQFQDWKCRNIFPHIVTWGGISIPYFGGMNIQVYIVYIHIIYIYIIHILYIYIYILYIYTAHYRCIIDPFIGYFGVHLASEFRLIPTCTAHKFKSSWPRADPATLLRSLGDTPGGAGGRPDIILHNEMEHGRKHFDRKRENTNDLDYAANIPRRHSWERLGLFFTGDTKKLLAKWAHWPYMELGSEHRSSYGFIATWFILVFFCKTAQHKKKKNSTRKNVNLAIFLLLTCYIANHSVSSSPYPQLQSGPPVGPCDEARGTATWLQRWWPLICPFFMGIHIWWLLNDYPVHIYIIILVWINLV